MSHLDCSTRLSSSSSFIKTAWCRFLPFTGSPEQTPHPITSACVCVCGFYDMHTCIHVWHVVAGLHHQRGETSVVWCGALCDFCVHSRAVDTVRTGPQMVSPEGRVAFSLNRYRVLAWRSITVCSVPYPLRAHTHTHSENHTQESPEDQ